MQSGTSLAYRALVVLRMGIAAGVAGVLFGKLRQRHIDTGKSLEHSLALRHFQTSSLWPVPRDHRGPAWTIRNDYPQRGVQHPLLSLCGRRTSGPPPPSDRPEDKPWSMVDFKTNPLEFCKVIKKYCWEGNVGNRFVVQDNRVRLVYRGFLK